MADLTFIVEVILSIAAVTVPIGVILVLLVAGDYTVADLFMAPKWDDRGQGRRAPIEEEAVPPWRLDRLRPRGHASGCVMSASRGSESAASAQHRARSSRSSSIDSLGQVDHGDLAGRAIEDAN